MAGGQERVLRRRIKSIQSTKKITKAMELIAASQIVRAQGRIASAKPYQQGMARIVLETALGDPVAAGRLLGTPETIGKVAVLSVVADRGLCGAYNTSVLRATERLIAGPARRPASSTGCSRWGRRRRDTSGSAARRWSGRSSGSASGRPSPMPRRGRRRAHAVRGRGGRPGGGGVHPLPVGRVPAGRGAPAPSACRSPPGEPTRRGGRRRRRRHEGPLGYTEFEPDAAILLETLAPRAAETEIFAALLEASASEVTSRQRAMAAATENAGELITKYSRIMNRARQDTITTEIMEIVGGAEALRAGPTTTSAD